MIGLVDQFGLKGTLEFRFNDDGARVIAVEVPEESKRDKGELEFRIMENLLIIYLIFSSAVPLVSRTRPHSSSLKGIPFEVPPQATYNQSASTGGTPSPRTSWTKALLDRELLPTAEHRLNASLIRFSSPGETERRSHRKLFIVDFNIHRLL